MKKEAMKKLSMFLKNIYNENRYKNHGPNNANNITKRKYTIL
jgi:hypothetical protein